MKSKTIKRLSVALAATIAVSMAAGCNPSFDDGGKSGVTEITVQVGSGCCKNASYLDAAIERFMESKKNEVYEDGKQGVSVTAMDPQDLSYDSSMMQYDILIGENRTNIYDLQSKGWLHDISNIVEKFESKIDPDIKERMKGSDGKYYSMPRHSFYCGISYNVSLFDKYNFYFAADDEEDVNEIDSQFIPAADGNFTEAGGKAKLIGSKNAKKSCGPNGVAGDYDDGLPSSVEEFLVLCQYIKEQGINPFAISGDGGNYNYGFMLVNAIWSGLVGAEGMKNIYCNWSGTEVEVVKLDASGNTLLTNEDLFYAGSGIKKPQTEKIVLNDDNGYRMYDMAARYYALGVLQVAYKNGWFCQDDWDGKSNLATQKDFLYGESNTGNQRKNRSAMLFDSSYWYGESIREGNIADYARKNPTDPVPHVSIMPMPTAYGGQVAEGEGKKPVLLDIGASQLFVSKNVENNAGKLRAVEDFIEFLYSDEELASFTESTGLQVAMTYDYDAKKLDEFYDRMKVITDNGVIIRPSSANIKYKSATSSFSVSWGGYVNNFNLDGLDCHDGSLYAMVNGKDMRAIFETTRRKTW